MGDLGNVEVSSAGEVAATLTDPLATLYWADAGIAGRALVLHAGEDDLGQGGAADSATTGAAGARLGCCIIELQGEQDPEEM